MAWLSYKPLLGLLRAPDSENCLGIKAMCLVFPCFEIAACKPSPALLWCLCDSASIFAFFQNPCEKSHSNKKVKSINNKIVLEEFLTHLLKKFSFQTAVALMQQFRCSLWLEKRAIKKLLKERNGSENWELVRRRRNREHLSNKER